jgi:hypothetical protein
MSYGPTFLYSPFPPFKKLVKSKTEETILLGEGWSDEPFSAEAKAVAARAAGSIADVAQEAREANAFMISRQVKVAKETKEEQKEPGNGEDLI